MHTIYVSVCPKCNELSSFRIERTEAADNVLVYRCGLCNETSLRSSFTQGIMRKDFPDFVEPPARDFSSTMTLFL